MELESRSRLTTASGTIALGQGAPLRLRLRRMSDGLMPYRRRNVVTKSGGVDSSAWRFRRRKRNGLEMSSCCMGAMKQ